MSTILLLCATHRDHRELINGTAGAGHRILPHDYGSLDVRRTKKPCMPDNDEPEVEIELIVNRYEDEQIDAVISTDDYPGSVLASIVAGIFRLPGVDPAVSLLCQHKYHARKAQRNVVPEAVSDFQSVDSSSRLAQSLAFPVFVKPVKSYFSIGAHPAFSLDDLGPARNSALSDKFFYPFSVLLEKYAHLELGPHRLLAESLLEGLQTTLEGYAFQGEIHPLGVVDSVMFPGTYSFERFEYPSRLPESVQERMEELAKKVMKSIGYDNGLFNIEFMFNPETDAVHIIEINPRMSSQFADLFEKVDGVNTYSILLDLALGKAPTVERRSGKHAMAANCILRTFEDKRVHKLPSVDEVENLQKQYPDIRVELLATEGEKLSQGIQDGHSFRYGIISIGGRDRKDILDTYDHCLSNLTFLWEKL